VAIITVIMANAFRLYEVSAIRVEMGRCRVKLIEGKKIRCFLCDELGHIASSCTVASPEKSAFAATNQVI